MKAIDEHRVVVGRPSVDLRLVPAALTAWAMSLFYAGVLGGGGEQICGVSECGWGAYVLPTVVMGVLGAAFSCALALYFSRAWSKSSASWNKSLWFHMLPGCVLCVAMAVAVSFSVAKIPEHGGGNVQRLQLEITDSPSAWQSSTSRSSDRDIPSWVKDAGEGTSGFMIKATDEYGRKITVFAQDRQWQQVTDGDVVTAVLTPVSDDPRMGLFRSSSPPHAMGTTEKSPMMMWLAGAKTQFLAQAINLGPEAGSLLPGMTYGDRSAFDPSLEQAMKDTGLTHLTAVSGSNCALVMLLAGHLMLSMGARRRVCVLAGFIALALFVLLVGPEASVLRAATMGSVAAMGVLLGRGGRSLSALGAAVCFLLIADPGLGDDFGFALSVCATAAIVISGPAMIQLLSRWMPPLLATTLAIPVVVQIWCAPILVLLSSAVPVWSVPANVVVAAVVPLITVIGLCALISFGLPGGVGDSLGQVLLALANFPAEGVGTVAYFFASLPGAVIAWWPPPAGPVVMAAVSVVAVIVLHRCDVVTAKPVKQGQVATSSMPSIVADQLRRAQRRRIRWMMRIAGITALIAAVIVITTSLVKPAVAHNWLAVMCDVGQGDALLLRGDTGEHKSTVLIDTGPEPGKVQKCLKGVGVDQIDLLILSHDHADHVAGAAGLDQHIRISQVWWSSSSGNPPQEIVRWSAPKGRPKPGTVAQLPGLRLEVLAAATGAIPETDSSGENNASLAVRVDIQGPQNFSRTSVFAAGDLEQEAASSLIRSSAGGADKKLDVDILKVSHHGAANGGTEIVEATSPAVALISVGEDNSYGHPHEKITTYLSRAGITVARTDQLGTVALYSAADEQALKVQPMR